MHLPEQIDKGFNFNEAIEMGELSCRIYKVFNETTSKDPQRLYSALYDDEWQFIHAIVDYKTQGRCMILKRKGRYQFVVVFRGSIFTGIGLELSNIANVVDDKMVEYPAFPNEKNPPPHDARVHQGFWNTYNALRDELELFFEILVGSQLEQRLLAGLVNADHIETTSRIAAIGAALGVKYGQDVQERVLQSLTQAVQQIKDGEKGLSTVSLDGLVNKEVKYRKVLEDLLGQSNATAIQATLEIYITGHSLGAAMATLCSLTLQRYFEVQGDFPPFRIKKYCLASPKVGNKFFVDYYNKQIAGYSYRIQNRLDPTIYFPPDSMPLQHYLTLMLPNVDHLRTGDEYYAFYQHVDEAFSVIGLGHETFDLDFGGAFKLSIPMLYPHGPDSYVALLMEARAWQMRMLRPFQGVMQILMSSQEERLGEIQKQLAAIQQELQTTKRGAVERHE